MWQASPEISSTGRDSAPAEVITGKVLSVFGTRPEIIKFAPVLGELEESWPGLSTVNVCTSQHTDLAAPFLSEFNIRVDYDLDIMRPGQHLNQLLGRLIQAVDEVLEKEQPDFVLVQGDTSSALSGATAAFQRQIPVGHIEAGLRSGNPLSPFPEEMNRMLIGQMAQAHFAATERNRKTLLDEGIDPDGIFLTGNPVVDAVTKMTSRETESEALQQLLAATDGSKRIILTAHRRENFAGAMAGYFEVLRDFLARHEDVSLIFPVHPNPNVRRITEEHLAGLDQVHLVDPMPYPEFIRLLSHAWLIVSDSGGIQEEAPTLRKPLLVIRENTERPESVECGAAKLIGEEPEALARHLDSAYDDTGWRERLNEVVNPFGDGNSRRRIASAISKFLAA
ncbi:MAG: UDP-N-acetylglucosamine 2-epimerase (non-hydrolyzing) [Verrucomicrobiales bacterium]|jgi:UDP-N-acetylglucosamine 2-epimerase (non-hydrolysing)